MIRNGSYKLKVYPASVPYEIDRFSVLDSPSKPIPPYHHIFWYWVGSYFNTGLPVMSNDKNQYVFRQRIDTSDGDGVLLLDSLCILHSTIQNYNVNSKDGLLNWIDSKYVVVDRTSEISNGSVLLTIYDNGRLHQLLREVGCYIDSDGLLGIDSDFGNMISRYICMGILDSAISVPNKSGDVSIAFPNTKRARMFHRVLIGGFLITPTPIVDGRRVVFRLNYALFVEIIQYSMIRFGWRDILYGDKRFSGEMRRDANKILNGMGVFDSLVNLPIEVRLFSSIGLKYNDVFDALFSYMDKSMKDNQLWCSAYLLQNKRPLVYIFDMDFDRVQTDEEYEAIMDTIEVKTDVPIALQDYNIDTLDMEDVMPPVSPITPKLSNPEVPDQDEGKHTRISDDSAVQQNEAYSEWIQASKNKPEAYEKIERPGTPNKPKPSESYDMKEMDEDPLRVWRDKSGWGEKSNAYSQKLEIGSMSIGLLEDERKFLSDTLAEECERRGFSFDEYTMIMGFLSGKEKHQMTNRKGKELYYAYVKRNERNDYDSTIKRLGGE